ncbi:MAG TPA: HD domain-containing phosphohydrolase [Terriglobia bacterium]|nr:HD domain-containing phosphohydrolase [Terriglobia bacterium]
MKTLYYFRPSAFARQLRRWADSRGGYALVALDRKARKPPAWESPAVVMLESGIDLARLEKLAPKEIAWSAIYLLKGKEPPDGVASSRAVFALLPRRAPAAALEKAIERAFDSLEALEARRRERNELRRATSDLATLNQIGIALSTERDTKALLDLILAKSRELTAADAGSLYLVEERQRGTSCLVFENAQNDSRTVPFRRFVLPLDPQSLAGYAATTGKPLNVEDAYHLDPRRGPRFNRDFDRRFKYRTRSTLVVPMKNQQGEVIGVLQLINAKKHAGAKLVSREAVEAEVIPFSPRSEELAKSLASQAAVALENNLLYSGIQRQFHGFVGAAGKAIEARDPTTFGHSERVAKLTVRLAEVVDRIATGEYARVHLSREEIRELEYAALLHDVGKVRVADHVLVKARKLYPRQLELIRKRFLYLRKATEAASLEKKLEFVLRQGRQGCQEEFAGIEAERDRQLEVLDDFLRTIVATNEPGFLDGKASSLLTEIAATNLGNDSGLSEPLLSPEEFHLLSIPRGTLDDAERAEIESHVLHSYNFLRQIPWTKDLKKIPQIARAHHEKLDGSGYPDHIQGQAIPIQARMMAISDVYDALTAADRPYKPAVTAQRALEIIEREVKSNLLDPGLFELFRDAKVYQLTARGRQGVGSRE